MNELLLFVAGIGLALAGGVMLGLRLGRRPTEDPGRRYEKYALAFTMNPDAVTLTTPDGVFLEVNDGFTHMSGHRPEDVVGRNVLELGLWQDPEDRRRLLAALDRDGCVRDAELHLRHVSGRDIPVSFSAVMLELEGERVLLASVRDITARIEAQEERAAMITELEAKNAELERFVYTVSHDLKSPLVTIAGFLGLLERDARDGDAERLGQDVERIRQAASTMHRLLDELLELSRVGRVTQPLEDVDLGEVAREALAALAGPIGARGVEVEVDPGLPVVHGERARLYHPAAALTPGRSGSA